MEWLEALLAYPMTWASGAELSRSKRAVARAKPKDVGTTFVADGDALGLPLA